MLRAWLLCLAAGCTFSPAQLATVAADAAPAAIDSRPMTMPDASLEPPDGGPCPVRTRQLSLGVTTGSSLGGQSRLDAVCAGGATGPEQVYELDVGGAASVDLVVDVLDNQPAIDSVVQVGDDCSGAGALCANRGRAGAGEVVVVEGVSPGRKFVTVDTLSGSGSFAVTAYLRGVVVEGAVCDRDLTASRCPRDLHCVDLDGDGVARCEELTAVAEHEGNDSPCAASDVLTGDSAVTGTIAGPGDVDVFALEPPADRDAHVMVHDGAGGCPADLTLELLTGAGCASASVTSNDDDGGLGPCPLLEATVPGGVRSWLRLATAPGSPDPTGARYVLEVDF